MRISDWSADVCSSDLPRGAFTDDPAKLALPQWYANNGQFVTTKFFGIKANHYIHKHGISEETLARVANKNFRNGVLNPNAFRRKEIRSEESRVGKECVSTCRSRCPQDN